MTKCAFNEICSRQTDFEASIACFRPSLATSLLLTVVSGLSIQNVRRNNKKKASATVVVL